MEKKSVIDRLIQNIDEKNCPIVVGLDPVISRIPIHLKDRALSKFGNTRQGAAEALFYFNRELIQELHTLIPAVKLQMACYELYGSFGISVFERTVVLAQQYGLSVIDDSKRNDIGNTARIYAQSHLGKTPLIEGEAELDKAEFLTINPFLGSDSIDPFVSECDKSNKGLFVLVRTSNPSSEEYQTAQAGNKPLFHQIALDLEKISSQRIGNKGFSNIGAVVGARWDKEADELRNLMPSVFFLVPGFGAQGATADQVSASFNKNGYGALINSSRGIIFAYESKESRKSNQNQENFAAASAEAVVEMRDSLLKALSKNSKLPDQW